MFQCYDEKTIEDMTDEMEMMTNPNLVEKRKEIFPLCVKALVISPFKAAAQKWKTCVTLVFQLIWLKLGTRTPKKGINVW